MIIANNTSKETISNLQKKIAVLEKQISILQNDTHLPQEEETVWVLFSYQIASSFKIICTYIHWNHVLSSSHLYFHCLYYWFCCWSPLLLCLFHSSMQADEDGFVLVRGRKKSAYGAIYYSHVEGEKGTERMLQSWLKRHLLFISTVFNLFNDYTRIDAIDPDSPEGVQTLKQSIRDIRKYMDEIKESSFFSNLMCALEKVFLFALLFRRDMHLII